MEGLREQRTRVVQNVNERIAEVRLQSAATIYRVPHTIREGDPTAYEPKFICIGPLHHNRNLPAAHRTKAAEDHKLRYLLDFLDRNPERILEDYVKKIQLSENIARACYAEEIPSRCEEFIEGMVLDSCFIIELFLRLTDKEIKKDDPIYGTSWLGEYIAYDLLLLENQLPFFILEDVYGIHGVNSAYPLPTLAMNFFNKWLQREETTFQVQPDSVSHLLHLVHKHLTHDLPHSSLPKLGSRFGLPSPIQKLCRSILPGFLERGSQSNLPTHHQVTLPSATRLHDAGVKFLKGKATNFLAIKFSNGRLEMPHLFLEDSTNSFLRNLIALEQCFPQPSHNYAFTLYAYFMDQLVNTPKDIDILCEKGIIEHALGSDEDAALFFNRLCKGIIIGFEDTYICKVRKQLNEYYKFQPHMWRAKLMRDYFSNPWAILSFLGALLLLALTMTQTLYSVLSYIKD